MNIETEFLLQRLPKKYHDRVDKLEVEPGLIDNCVYMLYWTNEYTDGEWVGGCYPVRSIKEAIHFIKNSLYKVDTSN